MLSDKIRGGRIALKTLSEWDSATTNNSSGIQLKVIPIIHGNQHIEPGNMIQALIADYWLWCWIIRTIQFPY